MPIALDSAVASGTAGFKQVVSWTHTVTSNTNGIMVVFASDNGTSNLTSLKFAGQALTKVISGTNGGGNPNADIYYLLAPPTGLGTFNGTWSAMTNDDKSVVSLAYTGVDQTTPILGSVSVLGTTVTSGSVTRTLSANNWFVGGYSIPTRPGTTNIGNERGTFSPDTAQEVLGADSTGGTLRWTNPSTSFIAQAIEISAAGAASTAILNYRTLLGVGR